MRLTLRFIGWLSISVALASPAWAMRDGVNDTVVFNQIGGPRIIVASGSSIAGIREPSSPVYEYREITSPLPPVGRSAPRGQYADGMNLYEYAKSSPAVYVDPQGTTCVRDVFPGVIVQKFKNSIGHQWLNIRGTYRGFYPNSDNGFPVIAPGGWYDELSINLVWVEDPPGSGKWVQIPRIQLAWANDWYDEWDTRRRCTGKLQAGGDKVKGKSCCDATDSDIISCLMKITAPGTGGTYCLIGGNCINHSEAALTRCCLRKNKQIHSGKPVPTGGSS